MTDQISEVPTVNVEEPVVSTMVTEDAVIDKVEEKEVVTIVPFETNEERLLAMQECEVLSKLINTNYFIICTDNGNNGKQQPKPTKSIQANYFGNTQLQVFGNRILKLQERLSA